MTGGLLSLTVVCATWLLLPGPEGAAAQEPKDRQRQPRAPEALPCVPVSEPLNFPTFWAGPSFEGTELTYVDRWCRVPPPSRLIGSNRVDYSYGDTDEVIPIQVRNYPAATMPKDRYTPEELAALGAEDTTLDGVPARWFGATKFEIYHPEVTVELGAHDRAEINRLVEALEGAPDVLVELSRYDLVFDETCVEASGGCLADRLRKESWLGSILSSVLLALIGPVLAIWFRPPPVPKTRRSSPA